MHAVIYTKDNCPYCTRAKAIFDKRGITYEEKIIPRGQQDDRKLTESQSWVTRDDLLAAAPAAKTVPQIWLDGEHIGGHDDLVKFLG